jgi:hypothetical protein
MRPQARMSNTRPVRLPILVAVFLSLPSLGACAPLAPPAASGAPALSERGIQLAVSRQSCAETSEPDDYGWDLVEETVEVQVRNGSSDAATIQRDRFRLLTPDGGALAALTWRAADPLTVPGGASQTFQLRFMTRGGLECSREMRLDADSAIQVRAFPVAFQPVAFTPRRAL